MNDHGHDVSGWDDMPDPVRKRSRVDAYMPWSSLQGLAPIGREPPAKVGAVEPHEAAILLGGCRLYRLSTARTGRSDP